MSRSIWPSGNGVDAEPGSPSNGWARPTTVTVPAGIAATRGSEGSVTEPRAIATAGPLEGRSGVITQ